MTPTDVRQRAATAREHLHVSLERLEMCRHDAGQSSEAQVAASNAVSAAIAAADALCGHALGQRAAGADHREAVALLRRVTGIGATLAPKLTRLLSDKTLFQYGGFCTRAQAERAAREAGSLVKELDRLSL
jgi:predicted flap endonuclease-1-like 5' DNA nuclease